MRLAFAVAIVLSLGQSDIERAQKIARGTDAARARFHGQYIFRVGDPTINQIEVVTDFRRAVIVTEDHVRRGDWMFARTVRAVEEALRPTLGLLTINAELRFNPLNAYVTVPAYELAIGAPSPDSRLTPIETRSTPQYSLPFKTPTGPGTAMLGATLEAHLVAAGIGQTSRAIGVVLDGKELARVTIDFRQIE